MKTTFRKSSYMNNIRKLLLITATAILMASCGTVKEYVLLNDINVDSTYSMPPIQQLHIKRGDDLRIVVTHKLPQLAEMFNNKINSLDEGESLTTYTVNDNGYINFPHIDTLFVEGMTCSEVEHLIAKKIEENGLAMGATVSVKINNFKITVIGEGATGIYEFDDEIVTLFDLIAKANLVQNNGGGISGTSIRRDKILVMREVEGVLHSDFVSLLSTDIFYSPYYYLQQNDIVYVWPSKTTIRGSNRIVDFWLSRMSIVTSAVSLATLIVTLVVKSNNQTN